MEFDISRLVRIGLVEPAEQPYVWKIWREGVIQEKNVDILVSSIVWDEIDNVRIDIQYYEEI